MNEEREKILDKARKLKELADRGVDGEKDNAKRFLETYMEKHKISDQELTRHKIKNEQQFAGVNTEQMIKEMTDELIAKGYDILANSYLSIFRNHFLLKNFENHRRTKKGGITIMWKHNESEYTHKGYIHGRLLFDIQETKKGATIYLSMGVRCSMQFPSLEAAEQFCGERVKDEYL